VEDLNYAHQLDRCENFGDIFDLVRRSVEDTLGRHRAGLMLVLAELPAHVGAFHVVGSNAIVVNRKFLKMAMGSSVSRTELNACIYTILLHEYLHSLGYLDEGQVRELVVRVTTQVMGEGHPATVISSRGYLPSFRHAERLAEGSGEDPELISDFDRSDQSYIA
jgi:hypothetical protein